MNSDRDIKLSKGETTRDVELRRVEARRNAELFKAVATFGAFALAVFGLGGPIVLALAEDLDRCFREVMIGVAGVAAFVITVCVLCSYHCLTKNAGGEEGQ